MKNFISKHDNFSRIEFWGATTIYVFAVFFLISHALNFNLASGQAGTTRTPFDYHFVNQLIRYTTLYVAFLILNFRIVPELVKRESVWVNITVTVILFLLIGLIFASTATFLKYYLQPHTVIDRARHNYLFQNGFLYALWLLLLYGFYCVIRFAGLYLLQRSDDLQAKHKMITPGGLAAFSIWMIILFFMVVGQAEKGIIATWVIIVPFSILMYWYSLHRLIPESLPRRRPFMSFLAKAFLLILLACLPVGLLAMALMPYNDAAAAITSFNVALQLLIIAPFSWIVFKRMQQGTEEIQVLKKELGRSHANFDFLRSQINPHFLFNALNTIYGTALQEGAERTGEGVEKLGNMMRFMLQENMQEKISLAREVEYLNNYISLQKLRTDVHPNIRIEVLIEEPLHTQQIAPMLLIPFVENAFKHGISFREPSTIKITMEMKEKTLFFDVYNSKHQRGENDPEKEKSGIGLTNVRQRLQLLYPGKHELIIRETGKDFFVHLTIQLT